MSARNNESDADAALDARLDALLRRNVVAPAPRFTDSVLRRIADAGAGADATATAAPSALDAIVDERLAARPLPATPERAERLFNGAIRSARRDNIIRWTSLALAASLAVLLALHVVVRPGAENSAAPGARMASTGEEILSRAMADDPALAAMLRAAATPAPGADSAPALVAANAVSAGVLDAEVSEALSGLNDNTLAWLETLTLPDNENAY